MTAEVGEDATTDGIVAEAEWALGIDHVVFGVNAAIAADLAQLTGLDHFPRQHEHRIAKVVEANLRLDACSFRRICHLARVGSARCQGFFAVNVLAGGDGSQRHLLVKGVRCRDVDEIDVRILNEGPPVPGRVGEAQRLRGLARQLVGTIGDGVQHDVVRQVEDPRRRGKAEDVGLAHEAGADQADPQDWLVTRHGRGLHSPR